MGVRGYATSLDKIDAPLNVFATLAHVPALQAILSLGAMVSFFALCLSCINARGRVIYAMGRRFSLSIAADPRPSPSCKPISTASTAVIKRCPR
jgi:amino acid transporter